MKTVLVLGFALLASSANAAVIYVPCADYGIPAPHSALAHVTHVVHHKPRHHRARGHRGSRTALLRQMCPVWLDTSLGGPAGDVPAGGWLEEISATDLGGADNGFLGGAATGGGSGSVQDAPAYAVTTIDTTLSVLTTTVINQTIINTGGPPCWRPTPVPELSTWLLMLLGFASLVLGRRLSCGALR